MFPIYLCFIAILSSESDNVQTRLLVSHEGVAPITTIAVSPDGRLLATASKQTVAVWDLTGRKRLRSWPVSDHNVDTYCVSFSPSGKMLATAARCDGRPLRVWQVSDGQLVKELDIFDKWGASAAVFLGTDDRLALCCVNKKSISIWDLKQGGPLQTISQPEPARCMAYEPTKKLLAWGRFDGNITIWDVEKRTELRSFPCSKFVVTSIAFSSDGSMLASSSYDVKAFTDIGSDAPAQPFGEVAVWNTSTGKKIHAFRHKWVDAVAFSPDGTTVASGGADSRIHLWDLRNDEQIAVLKALDTDTIFLGTKFVPQLPYELGDTHSLAFADGGKLLISGGGASIGIRSLGELVFWHWKNGDEGKVKVRRNENK